jgi:GNAT superfamily N-acetyltransferase|tara:strand:+ start:43030 stop:43515 length:486 start_codon:yes stop_codon:yes gene_type:complete
VLEEVPLDPDVHDRAGFDCGVAALNEYLRRFAGQHRRMGISATYVLIDSDQPRVVLGYYSLSAAEVDVARLSDSDRKKLPRFPIPCYRMGRLACRTDRRGAGLGRLLVGCAVDRCLQTKKQIPAYALLVDAKNASAKAFYEHYGFTPLLDRAMTLYLPLGR